MSETLMPENPVVDDGSESSSRRNLVVLLVAVVALAVVAGAAYFLFLSGSSDEDLGPVPSAAGTAGGGGDQGKANGKKDKDKTQQAVNDKHVITVGRDPFAPLAVEEPKPQPTTTGAGNTDTGQQSGGTPVQTPAPTPTPTDDAQSYSVTLLSVKVKQDQATFDVDGKRYVVSEKDMFPSSTIGPFKLISVGEKKSGKGTATVAFGSATTVALVVGESIEFTV